MTTIVAYHAQLVEADPTAIMVRKRAATGGADYLGMLDMLARTARWAMPGCRLVLATDHATEVPPDSPWERFRRRRDDYRVAVHRMETQSAFLAAQPPGDYVFIDTDCLVARDVSPLLREAEIGLCSPMPGSSKINAGVIYVASPQAGAKWFATAAETVRSKLTPEEQAWMGDQTAMVMMLFGKAPSRASDSCTWAGHHIAIHPSDLADWSPRDEDGPDSVGARLSYVWHFKGARKIRMRRFFDHMGGKRHAA